MDFVDMEDGNSESSRRLSTISERTERTELSPYWPRNDYLPPPRTVSTFTNSSYGNLIGESIQRSPSVYIAHLFQMPATLKILQVFLWIQILFPYHLPGLLYTGCRHMIQLHQRHPPYLIRLLRHTLPASLFLRSRRYQTFLILNLQLFLRLRPRNLHPSSRLRRPLHLPNRP